MKSLQTRTQIPREAVMTINSQGLQLQASQFQGRSENETAQILTYGLQAQENKFLVEEEKNGFHSVKINIYCLPIQQQFMNKVT